MRAAVIGGAGFMGTKVRKTFEALGHEAVTVDLTTGADTITGEGLEAALEGAEVVVDVTNSPSMAADEAQAFFTTSTTNLLRIERSLGIAHHVLLSIVGAPDVPQSGYLRAKAAQEAVLEASGVPYCTVRSTQFFDFLGTLVDGHRTGTTVRVPRTRFRPVDAADVAAYLVQMATHEPMDRVLEIAGPEQRWFEDFARAHLAALGDPSEVVSDPGAPFFDSPVGEHDLVPGPGATLAPTSYDAWAARSAVRT